MGFSVSGATAVMFVGVLVSAATLFPAVDHYTDRRADAVTAREERRLVQQNTAIEPANATYNASTGTLTIAVDNAGASTLAVSDVDLLVDGAYVTLSSAQTSVAGNSKTDVWASHERLVLTVEESTAPSRIKVVTGPGVAVTARVEVV